MADRVYMLSVNDLKEYTTINYAVEDKLLENSIYDAQQIDIMAVIGTRLYKVLEQKITGSTVAGHYKELMDDYIWNTLLKASEIRSLLWVYAKIRNKGIQEQSSDNSTPVEITVLDKMKKELSNDFEYYSNRLKKYLSEYKSTRFPEYKDYNPDSLDYYVTPDKSDSFFSGLYLDDSLTYEENYRRGLNEK